MADFKFSGLAAMAAALASGDLIAISDVSEGNSGSKKLTFDQLFTDAIHTLRRGTWTPTVSFDTPGSLSVSYTAQRGVYLKLGRWVWIECDLNFTPTLGTASGALKIEGLPFTPDSAIRAMFATGMPWSASASWPTSTTMATANIPGTSFVRLTGYGNGVGGSNFTTSNINSGGAHGLRFSGVYEATS